MLAAAVLLLAATALASPRPGAFVAKGFTPAERAWNDLGLVIRQSTCPTGYGVCVDNCYPLDGSVCCDDSTYCPQGHRCLTDGCCPIGEICVGVGGTRTVDFTSVISDPSSISSVVSSPAISTPTIEPVSSAPVSSPRPAPPPSSNGPPLSAGPSAQTPSNAGNGIGVGASRSTAPTVTQTVRVIGGAGAVAPAFAGILGAAAAAVALA
ncbi:hypothetical protein CC85DRAFT_300529 [Cutaneotrichosporon oleaginosum]|uniref:Granulins domain-containing protein n=1 Tax=Cutaneotrichosporon oleaginosum TaxID=879819 RepID=A0A0J0XTH5_9TREE|nr:uncharacterized protein CC85DRAFT_300529 [Cutaneotrichosporon oleaginosum]KLT44386.1 hypothetical protein CC85DRAFT_300529 [Cutaneotrichosporon oleaginosum]TXT07891.1 hypothetical protein COLE_04815 [Cutaneotrichosporon oleaginosum]